MNLARFDTPPEVANILCRHLPKTFKSILDPAVGAGTLLFPALKMIAKQDCKVIAVDIDKTALQQAKANLISNVAIAPKFICDEFVQWSMKKAVQRNLSNYFDCIVMNSPFLGRIKDWISLDLSHDSKQVTRKVPIEVAFLYRSLQFLKRGGRLLAVLPASVISSQTNEWIRNELLINGSIEIVHELPRFSFPKVESRMYLFVYVKGCKKTHIELRNHDITTPKKMILHKNDLDRRHRLDYSYYEVNQKYKSLIQSESLQWIKLSSVTDIIRDRNRLKKDDVIHTWCYRDCRWYRPRKYRSMDKASGIPVRQGDILITRVGRKCSTTIGMIKKNASGCMMSDCVLAIRPKTPSDAMKLLFVLRSTFCNSNGASLMERGSGASYISAHDLGELHIPWNLPEVYKRQYDSYRSAILAGDAVAMLAVEDEIKVKVWQPKRKYTC
ncbi:MAG: hypothetical protein A2283_03775 [Lentisphaerae bacterium RIFOXYA12_FULL_48_11]|nr:MAG: hypothetical protein A2283_03775 [Lentisphaerae bacterium RIFOXYA12_FULL_48_11]